MESFVVIASQTAVAEFIKLIGDNGVMIVISAVVVYFLVKVLNSMLKQNERLNAQIVPQLQQIEDSITDIMVKINEAESRRTVIQNRQLTETRQTEKNIIESLKKLDGRMDEAQMVVELLKDNQEKLSMYLEFAKNERNDRA